MKSIYSRFKGSGLVELLSEAGVGAEGTIKAGLSGSNIKQGIRFYKLLFEALLRSKLDFMERYVPSTSTSGIQGHSKEPIEGTFAASQSDDGVEMHECDDTQSIIQLENADLNGMGDRRGATCVIFGSNPMRLTLKWSASISRTVITVSQRQLSNVHMVIQVTWVTQLKLKV